MTGHGDVYAGREEWEHKWQFRVYTLLQPTTTPLVLLELEESPAAAAQILGWLRGGLDFEGVAGGGTEFQNSNTGRGGLSGVGPTSNESAL